MSFSDSYEVWTHCYPLRSGANVKRLHGTIAAELFQFAFEGFPIFAVFATFFTLLVIKCIGYLFEIATDRLPGGRPAGHARGFGMLCSDADQKFRCAQFADPEFYESGIVAL